MKKIIVACFAVLLFLVPAFISASSCDSAGEYYVKFTLEGEEYVCSFGHPESDVDVPYAAVTTGPLAAYETIVFFGGSWDAASEPEQPSFVVEVGGSLYVEIPGTYTGDYDLLMQYVWIWIWDYPNTYFYMASSGILTIDSFGVVGEAIEGTFNAVFMIPVALGDSPQSVSGSFRVKRISPDDLPPPV